MFNNDKKITSVIPYRSYFITEYSDNTITVSMRRYQDVYAAKKAIDRMVAILSILKEK